MPRMLKPSPGECADRQTILALKIKYGTGGNETSTRSETKTSTVGVVSRTVIESPSAVNIQPFIDENEQIQQYLEKLWLPELVENKPQQYDQYFDELAEVNSQVWKLMDQAHVLYDAPDKRQLQVNFRAAETLFSIVELNDKRAKLVGQINELFSIKVQEKIYA